MPRMARIGIPDVPRPVTQRGNCRADVFFDDEDRRRLWLLPGYARRHALNLAARKAGRPRKPPRPQGTGNRGSVHR